MLGYLDDILSDRQMLRRLNAHAALEERADHQPGPVGDGFFWIGLLENLKNGHATVNGMRDWESPLEE